MKKKNGAFREKLKKRIQVVHELLSYSCSIDVIAVKGIIGGAILILPPKKPLKV